MSLARAMQLRVAVVGSGPAGVSAAAALVGNGTPVDLIDYGCAESLETEQLARRLQTAEPDPGDLERLRPSGSPGGMLRTARRVGSLLLGRQPAFDLREKLHLGSAFAFDDVDEMIPLTGGFLARSLARGGLSNVWGASCYPLTADDYLDLDFPVAEPDMAPHFSEVAGFLSLLQAEDDLAGIYPVYGPATSLLRLNGPSASLLAHWSRYGERLGRLGVRFGRSRLAVRPPADGGSGNSCQLCGLCLYGCPYDAIYRSTWTLDELRRNPGFRYRGDLFVETFAESGPGVDLAIRHRCGGEQEVVRYDAVFLAAGTISTLRIVADSLGVYRRSTRILDNDVYIAPFLVTAGSSSWDGSYPFSLNELCLRVPFGQHQLHVQLYCLNRQLQERVSRLPERLPSAGRALLDRLSTRIMLAFIWFPAEVSADIRATAVPGEPRATVQVEVRRHRRSRPLIRSLLRFMARHFRPLGMFPTGLFVAATPEGPTGGHLVGALPMRRQPAPLETDLEGRLYGTRRVLVVDGAALPALPAQNCTYIMMANAHRIGTRYARRQRS